MAGGGATLLTLALVANSEDIWGKTLTSVWDITIASGAYPTNGYTLDPVNLGQLSRFKSISDAYFGARGAGALGYLYLYDPINKSVRLYTAGGTIAVPTVTVTGGQAAGAALQILPDSTSGVLGKTTATTQAIPGATFGIGSQAFTGAVGTEASGTIGGTTFIVRTRLFGF